MRPLQAQANNLQDKMAQATRRQQEAIKAPEPEALLPTHRRTRPTRQEAVTAVQAVTLTVGTGTAEEDLAEVPAEVVEAEAEVVVQDTRATSITSLGIYSKSS